MMNDNNKLTDLTKCEVAFCKQLRIKNSDSIQSLANKLNLSASLLYDVEAGRRPLSYNLFNKILKIYKVNYDFDEKKYADAYDLVLELLKKIATSDYDDICLMYLNNESRLNSSENSRAFMLIDIVKAIYYVAIKNTEKAKEHIEAANNYLFLYDNNMVAIYAILYVRVRKIKIHTEEISKLLNFVINNYPTNNLDTTVKAMLYYQVARVKDVERDYFESLKYLEKSYNNYQKLNIHERTIQVEIQKCSCYCELKQYELAKNKYLELLEKANRWEYNRSANVCANNLSLIYFIQKDYVNTMKYVEISRQNGSTFPDINYYEAYISYKTKPGYIARKEIKRLIDTVDDNKTVSIMNFIRAMLNENDEKVAKYFEKSKNYILQDNDRFDLQLLYEMAIEYYHVHDREKEYVLMCELIEILKS